MIDNLQLFWDFFFYPLTIIDSIGLIGDVLLLTIIMYAVFQFCMMSMTWFSTLKR